MRAHGLGAGEPAMAVIVQTMIDADKSGIITPTGSPNEMLVEATFGLGEPIISGAVEPDRYVIDRTSHEASSSPSVASRSCSVGDPTPMVTSSPSRIDSGPESSMTTNSPS